MRCTRRMVQEERVNSRRIHSVGSRSARGTRRLARNQSSRLAQCPRCVSAHMASLTSARAVLRARVGSRCIPRIGSRSTHGTRRLARHRQRTGLSRTPSILGGRDGSPTPISAGAKCHWPHSWVGAPSVLGSEPLQFLGRSPFGSWVGAPSAEPGHPPRCLERIRCVSARTAPSAHACRRLAGAVILPSARGLSEGNHRRRSSPRALRSRRHRPKPREGAALDIIVLPTRPLAARRPNPSGRRPTHGPRSKNESRNARVLQP